jgi:hypothetical protein
MAEPAIAATGSSGVIPSRASRVALVFLAQLARVLLLPIAAGDPQPAWLIGTVAVAAAVWLLPALGESTGASSWSTRAVLRVLASVDVAMAVLLVGLWWSFASTDFFVQPCFLLWCAEIAVLSLYVALATFDAGSRAAVLALAPLGTIVPFVMEAMEPHSNHGPPPSTVAASVFVASLAGLLLAMGALWRAERSGSRQVRARKFD